MEMAAAAPSAKKRRSEPIAGNRSPPSAMEAAAADPQPATKKERGAHNQEPHQLDAGGEGGGGDGAGVDRISALPDAILGEIISLLSTKDGARTQSLASRWRNIWSSAPLNLDGDDLPGDDDALVAAVSRIISTHRGPGRRFCIPPHHLHDRPGTVDAWLQSPALDNLQELDFWEARFRWPYPEYPPPPPPASVFRFSATLRVATFSKCRLLDSSVEALHCPQLKQLALEQVSISEASLHTMISNCPVLECLLFNLSFGVHCLRISSNSLRSIGVGTELYSEETLLRKLVIVDAPSLERLLYLRTDMKIHVSVIVAPKLETIGCLGNRFNPATLVIGTATIQGLRVVTLPMVVSSVKILALNPPDINLDTVIDLMKCFPCLEKLYIQSYISGDMNRWRRKHRHFIRSFDIPIKKIVLMYYRGIRSQVNFASFFLLNARQLDLMRLVVDDRDYNESFFNLQHEMLQMEGRASRGARLDITTDRCRRDLVHVNHVRDLSVTDPFECRC